VSQRGVQLMIGRLITDEDFRRQLAERGSAWFADRRSRRDLNSAEITALAETDFRVWSRIARLIDPRLHTVSETSRVDVQPVRELLTARQQQVLDGIWDGLTNKQIGARIGVSESAVKATLQQLFRKAHVRTRAQLVRAALEGSL